jgi:hypothetical protein
MEHQLLIILGAYIRARKLPSSYDNGHTRRLLWELRVVYSTDPGRRGTAKTDASMTWMF